MSSNYHTPIAFAAPVNSSVVNLPLGQLDSVFNQALTGSLGFTQFALAAATELTIAAGAITVTRSYHTVDTQADAATDDLDTITGVAGDTLILQLASASRVVTVKHNTGNILFASGIDFVFQNANQVLALFFNGTKWVDTAPPAAGRYKFYDNTLTGSAASVDIPSIPQTYAFIMIEAEIRSTRTGAIFDDFRIRLNGDTGNNYHYGQLILSGSTPSDAEAVNQSSVYLSGGVTSADASASRYAFMRIIIPNYINTARHKIVETLDYIFPDDTAADIQIFTGAGLWKSVSAVNQITLSCFNGNVASGSHIRLYLYN